MINLNPYTHLTLDEAKDKLDEYRKERKELEFKDKFGMHMSSKEKDRLGDIGALIEQMEFIIEWMELTDEDNYDD